jgi:hypothetical protein
MAQIIITTDFGEDICTFLIPAEEGWGLHVEEQLNGIIAALQDAIDKESRQRKTEIPER